MIAFTLKVGGNRVIKAKDGTEGLVKAMG
jgi:hypothetical protein